MLGGPSNPRRRAFRRVISSNSSAVSSFAGQRWPPSPWVCQQCRQHSGHTGRPLGPSISHSQSSRQFQIRRFKHSKSFRRLQSTGTSHVSEKPRSDLPSQEEGRRSHLSKRFNHVMDHLQSNIFIAGQRLNDLTGYSGIEALKKDIEEQGMFILGLRPFD